MDFQKVDGQLRCPRKCLSARSHVPPKMPTFAKFRLLQDRETRIFQLPSRCTRKRPSTGVVLITHRYMPSRKRRTRNGASCVMLDGALFDIPFRIESKSCQTNTVIPTKQMRWPRNRRFRFRKRPKQIQPKSSIKANPIIDQVTHN